jgi:cyclopropane-fatty-acyl-phospholipid synthase
MNRWGAGIMRLLSSNENYVREIFERIGIRITKEGERRSPCDIVVKDDSLYDRLIAKGSLAFGEGYMYEQWDCDDLEDVIYRILRGRIENNFGAKPTFFETLRYIVSRVKNLQSGRRILDVALGHYDIHEEVFREMLGPTMAYSCAFFSDGQNSLEDAQSKKFELVCRKLDIKEADTILDLGCGWGSFARYAAENFHCRVYAVNIAGNQISYGRNICTHLHDVHFINSDWRDITSHIDVRFDKIAAIGLGEHIGPKNYRHFMKTMHSILKDDGIMLMHNVAGNLTETDNDPWLDRYIFPRAVLPSIKMVGESIEGLFVLEDWHNLWGHYVKTLQCWYDNYDRAAREGRISLNRETDRMWRYYLKSCRASYRARYVQVWQYVLTKYRKDSYTGVRLAES